MPYCIEQKSGFEYDLTNQNQNTIEIFGMLILPEQVKLPNCLVR